MRIWRVVCCLALLGRVPANVWAADPPPSKGILLLHQAPGPGVFHGRFDLAFDEALRTEEAAPIELNEEVIEPLRSDGAEESRAVREYLRSKYAGRSIGAIVALGQSPLAFARANRSLFGDAPIVTITAPVGPIAGSGDDVTGLKGGYWINGTIDLAQALLPDTVRVFVVDGARGNGNFIQDEVERYLRARQRPIELVYLRDLPLRDVVARMAAIPAHSIVLFIKQTLRTPTQDVDQLDALRQIVAASPAPVFSYLEELVGHGIVGGYIWRFETDARRLATMAKQIANGATVGEIPTEQATYATLLDWRQLQQWKIPDSRLPAGSTVLFRPLSFLESHRGYVAGGAVVFAAQLALILGLLVERASRRRAEKESRNSETRYRSVVDSQSDLVCRFLPDTTLTFVNDAYCRFCNRTREDLIGRRFVELIPLSARDEVLARIGKLTRGSDSHEHQVLLSDGTIGWHHWVNHAIVDDRSGLIELQGVGRDITDRKRAEEALVHLEARNSAMLRAVPDLMFVMLLDGTYVDYHARDPRLLWAPPSAFLGKRIRDIMPPDLAETFVDAVARAGETDDTVVVEYALPMPDGNRHFEARLVRAGHDRVLSMVRDVTESKQTQEHNRDLAGRLIASQELERQRIARDLHDDLSQEIALLNNEIDQIAAHVKSDDDRSRLRRASRHAAEIARGVHNLSHDLHPSKLQTLGLITAVQSLCRDVERSMGVAIEFSYEGTFLAGFEADLCLYRIVQEALNNIVKHSRARHAWVRLTCEHGEVSLFIADSGIGFDPKAGGGEGLGLISMRERVGYLKGKLVIHSAPGVGTRIGVQIPLAGAAVASLPTTARSA